MGTNYYLMTPVRLGPNRWFIPKHLLHNDEPAHPGWWLHIGKSSCGWCFSLHVIPELGIESLDDWKTKWPEGEIKNEYGDTVSMEEMVGIIENRQGIEKNDTFFANARRYGYSSEKDFHRRNRSQPGPNNLARHKIDEYCVGHGEGTWDLMPGEFC